MNAPPQLSILIPVYNEEGILEQSLRALVRELDSVGYDYEIIVCENGSKDETSAIGTRLAQEVPRVRILNYHEPNYGGALRTGMRVARGDVLVCFEIDFWDVTFIRLALSELDSADIVIGSKRARGARDTRPFARRLATQVFNVLLRILVGFRGTDTHGLKALRRQAVADIVEICETDRDVFVTELIVRAQYLGLRIVEIPIAVHEIRPAPVNIYRRVPRALKQVLRLSQLSRGWRRQSRAARASRAGRRQAAA